ncbi:hypothetical protein JF540_22800 [Salipiger thiooxidans]|uniref:hypothetical protein n=1 Tax=Salipiger thiooxidans TaxID=282683 RepID=UPI001A8F4B52|nr:hypothetical protein [Salipiger thiooxidans]MBN8189519.1 hypothetical protein [Salipiger thiooxidans]
MTYEEKIEELEARIVAHRHYLAMLTVMLPPEMREHLKTVPEPFDPTSRLEVIAGEEFDHILGIAARPTDFEKK